MLIKSYIITLKIYIFTIVEVYRIKNSVKKERQSLFLVNTSLFRGYNTLCYDIVVNIKKFRVP